jgi:hypothetical protein
VAGYFVTPGVLVKLSSPNPEKDEVEHFIPTMGLDGQISL